MLKFIRKRDQKFFNFFFEKVGQKTFFCFNSKLNHCDKNINLNLKLNHKLGEPI
jgi:hypothetical protein